MTRSMLKCVIAALFVALLTLTTAEQASHGQMLSTGVGAGGFGSGSACNYPLAGLSATPMAAYALRPLSSGWSGDLVTLQRTSDSTQQTFGVSGCGMASTASFCTSTTCLVAKIYDQSGNGFDASQSTASDMPTFRASGQGGNPVMTMSGEQTLASAYSSILDTGDTINFSAYITAAATSAPNLAAFMFGQTGEGTPGWAINASLSSNDLFSIFANGGYNSNLTDVDSVWRTYLVTVNQSLPLISFYAGGNTARGTSANQPTSNSPGTGMSIGGGSGGGFPMNGTVGEAVFFSGNTANPLASSDRGNIYSATGAYWGAN